MTVEELIPLLRCPYCGSGLVLEQLGRRAPNASATDGRCGIAACGCYRYPIVDDIPVLRQRPGLDHHRDPLVARIERGDHRGALHEALRAMSPIPAAVRRSPARRVLGRWKRRVQRWARRGEGREEEAEPAFRAWLRRYRPRVYADYLYNRHANASFMAAVPLLTLFWRLLGDAHSCRVLDVNCGIGHATFLLQRLLPGASILGTDHDFVNLVVARRYMAPGASFVCADSEVSLPFPDGVLSGVLCVDGLHYVRGKRALLREVDRSSRPDAIWIFGHMHSALGQNVAAGQPLTPTDYQRLFDFVPSRMLAELDVLRQFAEDGSVSLETQPGCDRLNDAPVLTAVASRRPDVFTRHERQDDALLASPRALDINPIYTAQRAGDDVQLRMHWPSAELEGECAAVTEYLPRELTLNAAWLASAMSSGRSSARNQPLLRRLVRTSVLLELPPAYREPLPADV